MDMEEVLPDDMLADVLRRLPPSDLAASRCVCKHWCSIIDAQRLLPCVDLLPLRLDAFYCISLGLIDRFTYLFARPSAALGRIPGGCLDFLLGQDYHILDVADHCNGLLLVCDDMVVNPATRQWATLPISPEPSCIDYYLGLEDQDQENHLPPYSSSYYLVYDPMVESPQHFEVFLIPFLLERHVANRQNIAIDLEEQEWPPSTFRTHVFSSRRWRWEEKSWIRQGEPAGTMADMLSQPDYCEDREAVYFRGALYVQCQNDSVMRIALSDDKYQMVRSPATRSKLGAKSATFYLGKSKKGVYTALLYWVDWDSPQFQVWLLIEEEENGDVRHTHMEWVLKTNISLQPLLVQHPLLHSHDFADDEWRVILNYNSKEEAPSANAYGIDEFVADDEWDFDNADIILDETKDNKGVETDSHSAIDFLGFHPYKEIVFFSLSSRTISYNLNNSKVQRLGGKAHIPVGIRTCFPYTPCLLRMGELFENN